MEWRDKGTEVGETVSLHYGGCFLVLSQLKTFETEAYKITFKNSARTVLGKAGICERSFQQKSN